MLLLIEFDMDADIIDVPQYVIDNRNLLRKRFLKWLYNKHNKHKYWVLLPNSTSRQHYGLKYRSDALVEWLNKKVLKNPNDAAVIVEQYVSADKYGSDFPSIFL